MVANIKDLPSQELLLFKIEDVRRIEESQEDVRIQKLCKQVRLAFHVLEEVVKKIKEKTP